MDRGRTVAALLALAACIACSAAAPMASNQTALELLEGPKDGCYYNFQHYGENDRIMTNEPCLNCTCHNRMLMCYLRVCPFTKAIGQDCTVEKRADQCCPIVTCPDVPVDLLTSTSTSSPAEYGATGLGKLDKYGCSINGKYFSEGAKVPPSPNKPCEHCYCIRNMTTCVMQECTLHVDGCTPIYHKDVCCPVRYSCDHPEEDTLLLDDMTTTVRPTPGFLLTTTTILPVTQATQDCIHADQIFSDGALIKTEKACEHCYCMKGDIVCVVQECGTPMENEGKNCTSLPPRHGQCCPDTYICEGDEPGAELQTGIPEVTTSPPRRGGVEGSGYRNEPDESFTEVLPFEGSIEGSGEENVEAHTDTSEVFTPEKSTSKINDLLLTTTESSKIRHSTESDKEDNTIGDVENNLSIREKTTTPTTESNSGEKVTQDDIKTSYDDKLMTVNPEYHTESPNSNGLSIGDISVTTEFIEKDDKNIVLDDQKITTQDLVDKTTVKHDENNMLTTISTVEIEEDKTVYDKMTTQDLGSRTTKQEHIDSNYYATTESVEKIEDSVIVGEKMTTIHEHLDENDIATTETIQKIEENMVVNDKATTLDSSLKTTIQENIDSNYYTSTEAAEKIEDSFIIDGKKTTIHDFVDEMTPNKEYLDDSILVTTESAQEVDKNVNFDGQKTTTKDFDTKSTKLDDNDLITTESTHKIDENDILDSKMTTVKDYVDVTRKEEYVTAEPTDKVDDNVNIDKKITTTKDLSDETTTQENLDKNVFLTTETIEITDEHIIDGLTKTSISDVVDETTKHEHYDNKDLITTESIESVDDNFVADVKKTTTKYFDGESTKPENVGENDSVTTESLEKVDNNIITDNKKTTALEQIEETTLKQENLATTIEDIFDFDHKTSTRVPEHVQGIEYTMSKEELTTQKSSDISEFTKITMNEKESYTTKIYEKTNLYTTTNENLYSDKTTPVSLIENEITNNITPTLLPSRIPGEGDCLLNSVTYRNNSIVPSTNNCHTSCKCISSIVKCDPIICSPPPEYMNDCEPIYDSPDSCCPTYLCNTKEATPPQPHNQMSDSDNKNNLAVSECNTSDCLIQPTQTTSDCTGNECASSDQLCDKKSGCLETAVIPSCKGDNCGESPETSSTKETEISAQNIPVADCEDGNNCKPAETNIESDCADEKCKRKQNEGLDSKPSFECLDSECVQREKVLPSKMPVTELPVSDYLTAKTIVVPDYDEKADQNSKPVEVNTPINEAESTDLVTKEPTAPTTLKQTESDIITEKVVTYEPSVSNEKITIGPEHVTEFPGEIDTRTEEAITQMKSTQSYEIELSKTETVEEVETGTEKVKSPVDGESKVTYDYDDNKPHTTRPLNEKEFGNTEGYGTTSKDLYADEREQLNPEKQKIYITTLKENEFTSAPISQISEVEPYVTSSISETDQTVTEKQSFDTLAPYFKDNDTISVAIETENPATSTLASNVHESESDENKLVTQVPKLDASEQDKTPMSVSYETTEYNEVVTGYSEKTTINPNQISEIEKELHGVHPDSLTTTAFKDTDNVGTNIYENHPTTELNLKVSDTTITTQTQNVLGNESSTMEGTITSDSDVDSYTNKITESDVQATESPEHLVTVEQNKVDGKQNTYSDLVSTPHAPVTNNFDETTKISISISPELPAYTESEEKATITPEQMITHTESNEIAKGQDKEAVTRKDEPSQVNTEKSPVEEDKLPITENDYGSTEPSYIEIKETAITPTSEKTASSKEEIENEDMSLVTKEISDTESPEPVFTTKPTIFDSDKTVSEEVETHTDIPHQHFTDKKDSGYDDVTVAGDILTTPNTLLTTEAQPATVFDHTDTEVSHFAEPISNDDTASTEKIISVTEDQLYTNSPQEVDNAQTDIDTEKKEETVVNQETTTPKNAFETSQAEFVTTELSSLNNYERTTEITTEAEISETSKIGQTPPGSIFKTTSELHEITTEYLTRPTQNSEHQTSPSQEDLTTLAHEILISDKDITTPKSEIAIEQVNTDVGTILKEKEQNVKPTEVTLKQDVTTKETISDSKLANTTPYTLEADKTEPSIIVDIKESYDDKFSEKPQSHVSEASSEKQDYNTESTVSIPNEENHSPSLEKSTEKESNVDIPVTVIPDLYATAKEEITTKETPIVSHEKETKLPEFYTTLSDITSRPTEKEYTKLPQSNDIIPHVATTVMPLEYSTDIEITSSIVTESQTERILHEKTTLKPYDAKTPSVQTPINILGDDNIKSTIQEYDSTIAYTPVTETVDYHVKEQKPLEEEEESNTEKEPTKDKPQQHFEITTKLPAEHTTDSNIQVDISTEHPVQSEIDKVVSTSQEDIKTESPNLQHEKFSTVGSKTADEERVTETTFPDDNETQTQTPQTNIQNEAIPIRPEYEIEKTTYKQKTTMQTEPELITTESSLSKETPSINLPVSLVTEKIENESVDKQAEPHENIPIVTGKYDTTSEQSTLYSTVPQTEITSPNLLLTDNNDPSKVNSPTEIVQMESEITEKPATDYDKTSALPDVTGKYQNYSTEIPSGISTVDIGESDLRDDTLNIDKTPQIEYHTLIPQVTEIDQSTNTDLPDFIKDESVTKMSELPTNNLEYVSTLSSVQDKTSAITEASVNQSHEPDSQKQEDDSGLEITQTTVKYILPEIPESTGGSIEIANKYSETTPYLIELEEHTHQIKDDMTSGTSIEEESSTMHYIPPSTERGDLPISNDVNGFNNDNQVEQNYTENISVTTPIEEHSFEDTHKTTLNDDVSSTLSHATKDQESSTKYTTTSEEESVFNVPSSSIKSIDEQTYTTASYDTDKSSSPGTNIEILPEEEHKEEEKTDKPEPDRFSPDEDFSSISQSTTAKPTEEITTQSLELEVTAKPSEKPAETYLTPETPKPEFNEPPSDDTQSPDFPPSGAGGYGQEPDYGDEDQTFGPGTCRYGGKVYVSAQQIPRDDPCDFCFCFRSDIICLQQSCPPPIHGCHEEPIQGFCCPRYECPVSMATAVNVTTTTTTTTTTLPPHFLPHAYKGAAQRRGCQIKGHTYKVGEVVRASSGPCLHCTCGGDGQMKCDPKVCTPEPMLRQMIAAAVSAKRRR